MFPSGNTDRKLKAKTAEQEEVTVTRQPPVNTLPLQHTRGPYLGNGQATITTCFCAVREMEVSREFVVGRGDREDLVLGLRICKANKLGNYSSRL